MSSVASSPDTLRGAFVAGLGRRPKIIGIVPVVRLAILVTHVPLLDMERTKAVLGVFERVWETWKNTYRDVVAKLAQLSVDDLRFITWEKVRYKIDGKTPMIDLPRLQTTGTAEPLDLRNCLALCVEDFSSKVWTRVASPLESTNRAFPIEEMTAVIERFRAVAGRCGEWFYEQFVDLTRDVFKGIASQRGATLEITTLGLKVEGDYLDDGFDSWLIGREEDGSEGPNFDNDELCEYIKMAAKLEFHPRELRRNEPRSAWVSIESTVPLSDGELVSRKVLYMVRPFGTIVQIVGIGLDDSLNGDLAGDAALKLSRLVANRI